MATQMAIERIVQAWRFAFAGRSGRHFAALELGVALLHAGDGNAVQIVGLDLLLLGGAAIDDLLEPHAVEIEMMNQTAAGFNAYRYQRAAAHAVVTQRSQARQHGLQGEADHIGIARIQPLCELFDLTKIAGADAQRYGLLSGISHPVSPPFETLLISG